jgi:hypothetical protein
VKKDCACGPLIVTPLETNVIAAFFQVACADVRQIVRLTVERRQGCSRWAVAQDRRWNGGRECRTFSSPTRSPPVWIRYQNIPNKQDNRASKLPPPLDPISVGICESIVLAEENHCITVQVFS